MDSSDDASLRHRLYVCTTCRPPAHDDSHPRPGALFYQRICAAAAQRETADGRSMQIVPVECLLQCQSFCAAAMSHTQKYQYLLSGLDFAAHAQDLLDFFARYQESEDGFVSFGKRPPSMRGRVCGRIPPVSDVRMPQE